MPWVQLYTLNLHLTGFSNIFELIFKYGFKTDYYPLEKSRMSYIEEWCIEDIFLYKENKNR